LVSLPVSYISRLEKRLEDIEGTLKQLQQDHRSATPTKTTALIQNESGTDVENNTSPSRDSSSSPGQAHIAFSDKAEIREIDTAEDSIDGMGAIQFTDEEDCGYFGIQLRLD
jgi:hypothetical protein